MTADREVLGLPARRLGNGLLWFGVAGLVVSVVLVLIWLGAFLGMRDL
jgi:hypothetical protein